jgi:hypothetical protein
VHLLSTAFRIVKDLAADTSSGSKCRPGKAKNHLPDENVRCYAAKRKGFYILLLLFRVRSYEEIPAKTS